jgi:GNAT superfamily N-acetyltransferase/2'-5' RNA ligase
MSLLDKKAVETVTLYHGTCAENAKRLINNGWRPNQVPQGGNIGQTKYLYLSTGYNDALWFAEEKGCNVVLEVTCPMDSLKVDPEDGFAETVEDELSTEERIGTPGKLVLTKPLGAEHFTVVSHNMPEFQKDAKIHSNASTQVDVPGDVAAKIIQVGKELIPDEYLTGEGRVLTPHVTVKYGVKEDEQALRTICQHHAPFSGQLGKTSAFTASENNAGGVPVVVEVNGQGFHDLHDEVMNAIGTQPDDFTYTPHITIAYVKPVEAQHFVGSDAFAGISFQASAVVLSKHDDNDQVKIPLGKAMAQTAAEQEEIPFVITVWPVDFDNSPQGYTVKYPPLERDVKICRSLPELKKICRDAAARYEGRADTIVTSGYLMQGPDELQPKMRGLKQFWESGPFKSRKSAASPQVAPEIPQRPPQETDDVEPESRPQYEYRKQTHGDNWIIYNKDGDAVAFADSEQQAQDWLSSPDTLRKLDRGEQPEEVERTEPAVQTTKKPRKWKAPTKPVTETSNFKKWFGSSKVVDEDGEPMKVYHGTTHEVETFDIDKTNEENYYGKGFYFSSSAYDVETNYATDKGGDITARISRRTEEIQQELEGKFEDEHGYTADGIEMQEIEEEAGRLAREEVVGPNKGTTMAVYLRIRKPVVVEKGGGTWFEYRYNERTGEESGSAVELYEAVMNAASHWGTDGGRIWSEANEKIGNPEFTAYDFEEAVRGLDYIEDENGSVNTGAFIGDVYKAAGFDGIIQDAWGEFGGGSKYKGMEMEWGTKHYIVWDPRQIKSAIGNVGKFDKKNPAITAAVTEEDRQTLKTLGSDIVEEKTIGDYDFFVTYEKNFGIYQIGMQRVGMSAVDLGQQFEQQKQDRGKGSRRELKQTIQQWIDKYHVLVVASMNPAKTLKYVRLLQALGFQPKQQSFMGVPLILLTDGTVKISKRKQARKGDTTSMTLGVDSEHVPGFPAVVLVRWEQGMRWRQVLKAVKAIVGEIAGHRVPWRDIYIWSSLWGNYEEQQAGWEEYKGRKRSVMFDVLHNGSFVSVGAPYQTTAVVAGEESPDAPCPDCGAPKSKHAAFRIIALNIPRLVQDFGQKLVARYFADLGVTQPVDAGVDLPEKIINELKKSDPTANFEYTAWLTGNYARGDIGAFKEIPQKIAPLLVRFNDLKKGKYLDASERDIGRIKGAAQLTQVIEKYAEVVAESERKKKAEREKQLFTEGKATLFYDDGNIKIIIPNTEEAAIYFGINTKWCTAASEGMNHFQNYAEDGPLYIILFKAENRRYQFHFPSAQFMDEQDVEIVPGTFLPAHPKLAELFLPIAEEAVDDGKAQCEDCGGSGGDTCSCDDGTVECDYCSGRGSEDCDTCEGAGELSCEKCDGSGQLTDDEGNEEECSSCDGSGTRPCPDCEDSSGSIECPNCEGSGGWTCEECGGTGRATCTECEGKGYLPDLHAFIVAARRTVQAAKAQGAAAGKTSDSHKETPFSDTQYENPEQGMETNAYADTYERVKGIYELPSLEELAPQMFTAAERVQDSATDQIKCICGNEPHKEGFYWCDQFGKYIDDYDDWDGHYIRCDRCGRVINQKTGRVMGKADKNLFGEVSVTAAELPEEDIARTDEEIAKIREEVKDVEITYEVMDSHRGELSAEVGAWLHGKPIGYVSFSELEDDDTSDPNQYKEMEDEYGGKYWEQVGEIPREVHIKYVYVAPRYRRVGVGTMMYEKIKKEFPGEPIRSSGTTERGGKFRNSLLNRGVITAVFAEAQNEVRHSDHLLDSEATGTTKTLKSDPFMLETQVLHESLGKEPKPMNPALPTGRSEQTPPAEGEAELQMTSSFHIEAVNYDEMFKNILELTPKGGLTAADVKQEIAWAKKDLKKQDRIVWWLRWYRLALLGVIVENLQQQARVKQEEAKLYTELGGAEHQQNEQSATEAQQKADMAMRYLQGEEKALGNRTGRDMMGIPHKRPDWYKGMHTKMQHLMSLPVAKIQNTVWDKQTPEALVTEFENYEKEWGEDIKGKLKPNLEPVWTSEDAQRIQRMRQNVEYHLSRGDTEKAERLQEEIKKLEDEIAERGEQPEVDTVFLQFQDGWAWWKLSRAYCSEEARAMGHCGNVVGQDRPDERILSLRKPSKVGKETWWEPHLTFILEPNGQLGEMKGKANNKPTAAYHKYIIPLLEDPRIKGIRGGGYAPERNFSLADLPKEEQERLTAAKPGLLNAEMYLAKFGPTEEWVRRVDETLEWDYSHSTKLGGWEINTYKSLDDFVQETGNDTAKWIGRVFSGDENLDYYEGISLSDAIENLDTAGEEMVRNYIRVTYPEEVKAWEKEYDTELDNSNLGDAISEMSLDDVEQDLTRAVETGRRYGAEKEMYEALTSAIENMGSDDNNRLGSAVAYKTYTDPKTGKVSPVWDSPVTEYFPNTSAAKLADSGSNWEQIEENEYGYYSGTSALNVEEPHYGWDGWDQEGFMEEIKQSFGQPKSPEDEAKHQAELEAEAKKRPDLIPVRTNGKITGWGHNPNYKGPKLGPGGVEVDEKGNPIKKKPAPKKKKKRKSHLLNKKAAEPWEMSEREYAAKDWTPEETEEEAKERYRRKRVWQQNALGAVSLGKLTPQEAKARGAYDTEKFKPLPPDLYHVTTAKSKVLAEGLKTRQEMNMGSGTGLGGGTEQAISFTADPEIARGIYENLLIARRVAAGEMTLDDLIETATKGEGANRPWINDILKSLGGSSGTKDFGDKMVDALKRGVTWEQSMGRPPQEGWADQGTLRTKPGNWRPAPWSYHWTGGDGNEYYSNWERDLTPKERQEAIFDFFKKWSFFREQAGGGLDPLYFMSDPEALGKTPESEIAILHFKPVPGAMGTQESALGEWRTYTGAAVKLVGEGLAKGQTAAVKPFPNSVVQQVVYHGTNEPFTRVDMGRGAQGVFWVTSDRSKIERGESGATSSKHILPMYINIQKPAGWPEYEKYSLGELKRDYDGVILNDEDGSFDAIVFKPNQVKMIKELKQNA